MIWGDCVWFSWEFNRWKSRLLLRIARHFSLERDFKCLWYWFKISFSCDKVISLLPHFICQFLVVSCPFVIYDLPHFSFHSSPDHPAYCVFFTFNCASWSFGLYFWLEFEYFGFKCQLCCILFILKVLCCFVGSLLAWLLLCPFIQNIGSFVPCIIDLRLALHSFKVIKANVLIVILIKRYFASLVKKGRSFLFEFIFSITIQSLQRFSIAQLWFGPTFTSLLS